MSRGYAAVALWRPKSKDNYGTALRSCVAFDVDLIEIIEGRFARHPADVSRSWSKIPLLPDLEDLVVPFDCVPVAVELGGRDLVHYVHPERALYVFGPEDASVPPRVLARCRDVVTIPGRYCLNLASAVTVLLYDRAAKARDNASGLALPERATRRAAK